MILNITDNYVKNIIAGILFIGILLITSSLVSTNTNKNDLILEAVMQNNICATKFLIEQKIDINKKYRYGHTLLHNAALYGDINMVKLLVKNGAKLIKNDFGLTAIDSARDNGHSEVVEYLVGCYRSFDRMDEYIRGKIK